MNKVTTALSCAFIGCTAIANAETVFSGLDFTFEYAGFGDISLEENQDRMTDNVWITRSTTRGIFNIAQEPSFQGDGANSISPIGTTWAFGTTDDYDTLDYTTWVDLHDGFPFGLINRNVVVYLEDDDFYIDLMFTDWAEGGSGGGFSYVRSTIPTPSSGALLAIAGLIASRRRR